MIGSVPRLRMKSAARTSMVFALRAGDARKLAAPSKARFWGPSALGAVLVKVPVRRLAGPVAAILLPAGFFWMSYYNYRVTGNPLMLAYREHERQYATWSPFVWDTHPRPAPHYNHEDLRAVWIGWEESARREDRAQPGLQRLVGFGRLEDFYTGIPLTLCILVLAVPIWRKQPKIRLALILLLLFGLGLGMETFVWAHYAAPATALAFVVATAAIRFFRHSAPAAMIVVLAIIILTNVWRWTTGDSRWLFDKRDFVAERKSVLPRLLQSPGKQLVFVDYGPMHDVNHEWVYNEADLDASKIVWAHAMNPQQDAELIHYFSNRTIWRFVDNGDGHFELARALSTRAAN